MESGANKQIRVAVSAELVDLTQARNVKALTKHACGYRLRVVSIEEIKKRDERTY